MVVEEALFEAVARVDDDRQAARFTLGPERLPVCVEERRLTGVGEEAGCERSSEAVIREPSQLGDGRVHVGTRAHGADEQQTVRRGTERVVRPAVVRTRPCIPHIEWPHAIRHIVGEISHAGVAVVHQLGGDALTIHLFEAHIEVVNSPKSPRLGQVLEGDLGAVHRPLGQRHDRTRVQIALVLDLRQVLVETPVEILGPELGRHRGVRIGRDDDHSTHRTPSWTR